MKNSVKSAYIGRLKERGALNPCFILLSGLLVLGTLSSSFASGASGGEPGRFLSYGAGGRPLAMGGAFYAVADDATAAYWNPAGLAMVEKKELVAMYASLFAGTNMGFLAFAQPTSGKGTFGLTYTQLVSDGFEKIAVTQDSAGNITGIQTLGTFSDIQRGIGFSWGRNISERIRLGTSLKHVTRQLDTSSDSHIAMDITTLMNGINPSHRFALGAHNVIAMKSGDTDDELPLAIRVGNAYKLIRNKLGMGMDFDLSQRSGVSWRFGGEYWVINWIAFRFGLQGDPGNTSSPREMNFGVGMNYQNFSLDLASAIHDLGVTTRFSGSWRFGTSARAAQEARVRRMIQLGFDALRQGNFILGLQRLQQALDAQPNNKTLNNMIKRLEEVASLYPQSLGDGEIAAFVRKGSALYVVGNDLKGSVNALRYAFNRNVKDEKVLNLLNLVEKAANVPELTRRIDGPQIFSWVDQKVFDSRSSFQEARYDLVIRRCQDILDLEPNNVTALEIMGSAFFMLDQKDKAAVIWRRVMEIDPGNKTVRPFLEQINSQKQ